MSKDPLVPGEVPRLVEWLRSERPSATDHDLTTLLGRVPPALARRLEHVLDDLARGCLPPAPADLAALAELDDLLAPGTSG